MLFGEVTISLLMFYFFRFTLLTSLQKAHSILIFNGALNLFLQGTGFGSTQLSLSR